MAALSEVGRAIAYEEGEAVNYAIVSARLFALATFGESAVYIRRRCTRRLQKRDEMRMYDCTAMLVCGFLVLGQLMDALSAILPPEVDSGTFLGIVVAGFSFSLRDIVACLMAGLFENISPRFHVEDEIELRGVKLRVVHKSLCFVDGIDTAGSRVSIPQTVLASDSVVVCSAAADGAAQ